MCTRLYKHRKWWERKRERTREQRERERERAAAYSKLCGGLDTSHQTDHALYAVSISILLLPICDSRCMLAHTAYEHASRLCGCYVQQPLMNSSSRNSIFFLCFTEIWIRFSLNREQNLHTMSSTVFLLYAFISEKLWFNTHKHTIKYMQRQISQAIKREKEQMSRARLWMAKLCDAYISTCMCT